MELVRWRENLFGNFVCVLELFIRILDSLAWIVSRGWPRVDSLATLK